MGSNHQIFSDRRVTLNGLKEELHSLNMRLLLAFANHNDAVQEEIRRQLASVQAEIDDMRLGRRG